MRLPSATSLLLLAFPLFGSCASRTIPSADDQRIQNITDSAAYSRGLEKATFAMGCFWHSEEMFLELRGVVDAVPGYAGGTEPEPTYDLVSSGSTRYAESADVTYDPRVIDYRTLLAIFFREHDPTTPNAQYPDEGPQYRSAIFYRNGVQMLVAREFIDSLRAAHAYSRPIVTEVLPIARFYPAESYHRKYVRTHPSEAYVASVTKPELARFRRDFGALVRTPQDSIR